MFSSKQIKITISIFAISLLNSGCAIVYKSSEVQDAPFNKNKTIESSEYGFLGGLLPIYRTSREVVKDKVNKVTKPATDPVNKEAEK